MSPSDGAPDVSLGAEFEEGEGATAGGAGASWAELGRVGRVLFRDGIKSAGLFGGKK